MRSTVLRVIALALCVVAELSGTRLQDNPPSLDTYNDCPMTGDGQSAGVQALNRLKNRYTAPSDAQINPKMTLAAMLALGIDTGRWKTSYGAEISGYVEDVKPGGIETVNCHAKALPDRDTHIELVLDPMNSGSAQRVIVEVTPRWRAIEASQDVNWSTAALRTKLVGRWVTVRGWMLFDVEHANASVNSAPSNPKDWRATAWEIHPITSFQVLPHKPQ